jgi:hypothetical protein
VSEGPTGEELEGLSEEELERHRIEQLPDREAMSIIGDVSIPLDPDAAANALIGSDPPVAPDHSDGGA